MIRKIQTMSMELIIESFPELSESVIDDINNLLTLIDDTFNNYNSNSYISKLNLKKKTIDDSPKVFKYVKELADEYRKKTNGYFEYEFNGFLNFNGIVKAYAISKIKDILLTNNINNFLINFGGDIKTHGIDLKVNNNWVVGIKNPYTKNDILKRIKLYKNYSISTSGSYERGYHILNPILKKSATYFDSVTVVSESIIDSDVFATALYAMEDNAYTYILEKNILALFIKNNKIYFNSNLQKLCNQ